MGEKSGRMAQDRLSLKHFWGLRPWNRHGLILAVAGFAFVLIGFQYIVAKPSKNRELALTAILRFFPIQFWGSVFIFCGLLAMVSSRWPKISETWGYMVLTGMSSMWGTTYLFGMLFFHAPAANSTQVVLWGIFGFLWWAISGLVNPDGTAVANNGSG